MSLARKLGVALAAGAGTLVLLEGGARLLVGDEVRLLTDVPMNALVTPDPELGWRNRRDVEALALGPTMQFPVFEYRVTLNSRGLRDREYPPEPPPGVLRVVLLGDSFAWGWGVDDGASFADLLDDELGPGVEVVNLGVPGYGTDQELLWFEREGRRYRPDLVLLCLLLNDVEGNHEDFRDGMGKPRLVREGDGYRFDNLPVANAPAGTGAGGLGALARRHLALARLLAPERVVRPERDSEWAHMPPEAVRAMLLELEWPFFSADDVERLSLELSDPRSPTVELLRRLRADAGAVGAPLVAFSVAHHHDHYLTIPGKPEPPEVAEAERAGVPFRTGLARRLAAAGEEVGFETLSVDQAMLEAVRAGELLNVGDGHLNERGNAIVAAELAAWLRPRLAELGR